MNRKTMKGLVLAAILIIVVTIPMCIVNIRAEESTTMPMKISDSMITLLKELEGFNPHAYWDYKQWSIGYGSKCPDDEVYYYREDGAGNKISDEYAEQLLRKELDYFEKEINGYIQAFELTLEQHQYDALVSFTYNTGAGWMRNSNGSYKNTGNFPSAVVSGNKGTHLIYGLMLYSYAGKEHILIKRRTIEMNVYVNGVYDFENLPEQYRVAYMDGNGGVVKYEEHGFDAKDPVPIRTEFKSVPTGPDETGAMVTYEFDGWYTARVGGTKVEMLDESMPHGVVLYAHWKTPSGTPITIEPLNTGIKFPVQVTDDVMSIRSGPETWFQMVRQANKGDILEITNVVRRGSFFWGQSGDEWICLDSTSYKKDYTNYKEVKEQMLPMKGKVTASTLNVRKGAGTNYEKVEGVTKVAGDLIQITDWESDEVQMWGKIEEGWVFLPYVSFETVSVPDQTIQSISMNARPQKLTYVQMSDALDVSGGKLLVTFSDETTQLVDITPEMVTDFDNSSIGTNTLTVTYEGRTTTFDVEIVKAKVVFQMDDGTVISEAEYLYGDTVQVPEIPAKPADSNGYYIFKGWDKEVTTCAGNAIYKAVFEQKGITGDGNGDGKVNDQDAIYLLRHVYFPDRYPILEPVDYNKDGKVNDQDAIYLLRHVYFPDRYPLS